MRWRSGGAPIAVIRRNGMRAIVIGTLLALALHTVAVARQPPQGNPPAPPQAGRGGRPGGQPPAGGGGYANSYPQRAPDPAMVERGNVLYGVHCSFCHGPDARGGQG